MRWLLPVALVIACDPPAPRLMEVVTPGKTADVRGPYQVTAVVRGVVSEVRLFWMVGDPEEGPAVHSMDARGGAWRGEIPGQRHGSEVRLWIEAEGPGGEARSPTGSGVHVFNVLHHDGACVVDGDCPVGEVCDRLEGRCHVPPEPCEDNGDCAADYVCVDGACRFRTERCAGDADCGEGASCVEGRCVGDAPVDCGGGCPPDHVCEDGACVPVDNEACGGCPDGLRCLAEIGECVECHADGHCGEGNHCDMASSSCERGPRTSPCTPCEPGSCSSGQTCAPVYAFVCLPRCGRRRGCPAGTECSEGVCAPAEFCYADACRRDEDCDSGVCQAGFCEPLQLCERAGDCAADRACTDGRCVDPRPLCDRPGACDEGELCVAGRCVPGEPMSMCQPCEHSLDCDSAAVCADGGEGSLACYSFCRDRCPRDGECVVTGDRRGVGVCLDPGSGGCIPEERCGGDGFEPNDGLESATVLRANRGGINPRLCVTDTDTFVLERSGAAAFVDIFAEAPMTLRSFNAEGDSLNVVEVARGDVTFALRDSTRFLMFTTSVDGGFGYRVELRERAAAGCNDDNLEPDDQREEASVLGNGAAIRAVACPGDPDWYRIRVRRRQEGTVTLGSGDRRAPLRYLLQSEDGSALGDGPIVRETVLHVANEGQRLFLRVDCDECEGGVGYSVQTRFQ